MPSEQMIETLRQELQLGAPDLTREVQAALTNTRVAQALADTFAMTPPVVVQNLRADSDPNGNPQRLWVAYDAATGATLGIFDEGYSGKGCLPAEYRSAPEIMAVGISKQQYHNYLRRARSGLE